MNDEILKSFTKDQRAAYDAIMSGENCFITGGAGTGKTTAVRYAISMLKARGKQVIVCAPTGIAATIIGGATIHKTFGFPASMCITEKTMKIMVRAPKTVAYADAVVIDEISMCRMDVFDATVASIQKIQEKAEKKIQLIAVGDFYQLPPILDNRHGERKIFQAVYKNMPAVPFAFAGVAWKKCRFTSVVLQEVVRQSGTTFVHNLNLCREGNRECLSYFNNATCKTEFEDAVYLYPTNRDVDKENLDHLNDLPGELCCFETIFDDTLKRSDQRDIPKQIYLKKGCRVIITINDTDDDVSEDPFESPFNPLKPKREPKYHNGSFGTVMAIDNGNTDTSQDNVIVRVDGGHEIIFYRKKYNVYEYIVENDKVKRRVVGSYRQFPIRPAYAITVHRSQGQTYERANIDPYCDNSGQLYVALSRVKDVSGIHLQHRIQLWNLKVDPTVTEFYKHLFDPYVEEDSELTAEDEASTHQNEILDTETDTSMPVKQKPRKQTQRPRQKKPVNPNVKKQSCAPSPKGGRPRRFPNGSAQQRIPTELQGMFQQVIDTLFPADIPPTFDQEKLDGLREYIEKAFPKQKGEDKDS